MSELNLTHSNGNKVKLTTPDTLAANKTFKLPGADGSSGQFLKTDGSGALSFATALTTPAFKNFGKTTISSSLSTVDIDFDHTNYNNFKLMILGFNPSADCNMYCRFKIQGSYSTINGYTSYNDKIHSGGVDEQIYGNQNQNYGYLSNNVGGADGTYERWSAQMTFNCAGHNMGMPFMEYHAFCKDAASNHVMHRGVIAYQNWKTIEGIRIYPSTGTIDNGTYELYGF